MANPENIKPPVKGEIRNPNGRGLGHKNRATILKKWIKVAAKFPHPENEDIELEGTIEDKVALSLVAKALSGDVQAIKEINDTLYGKITEKTDVTTGGEKLNITFTRHEP